MHRRSIDHLRGPGIRGSFVDADGQPGIALSRPVGVNEQIFAVDVCAGISGVAVTTIRPAPPLSVGGAALALALMGLVAWRRGRRATH